MCTIKINECWRNFVSEENGENLHSIRLEGSQVSSRLHANFDDDCVLCCKKKYRGNTFDEKFKPQMF